MRHLPVSNQEAIMIRSLIAPARTPTANGRKEQNNVIRRNLPLDDLERMLIGKTKVWIGVI